MKITEVILKPGDGNKVVHFLDIILENSYRINDLKIIKRDDGSLHVTGPSRVMKIKCICGSNNVMHANFCNWCGKQLDSVKPIYIEIFHPINQQARNLLQKVIPNENCIHELDSGT